MTSLEWGIPPVPPPPKGVLSAVVLHTTFLLGIYSYVYGGHYLGNVSGWIANDVIRMGDSPYALRSVLSAVVFRAIFLLQIVAL